MDWLEWLENSEDSSLISSCRLWTRREARCLYSWCIADSSSLISGTCKNTTHSVTPNSSAVTHLRVPCYFRFLKKYSMDKTSISPTKSSAAQHSTEGGSTASYNYTSSAWSPQQRNSRNGTFLLTEQGKAVVLHLQRKCVCLGVFNMLFSSNMNYIDSNFVGFFFYFYFWRWSLCSFSWFRTQYGPKHPPVLCSWMLQLQAHTTFGKLSGLKDCSVVPKPATTTLPAISLHKPRTLWRHASLQLYCTS